MRLTALEYVENRDTPREWRLTGLTLESINLLVGKNASGKTRTLNVLNGLALLLSGSGAGAPPLSFASGDYDALFSQGSSKLRYKLRYEDAKVIAEQLVVDDKMLIERGVGGVGKIF